jgi:hypothetical protein
MDGQDFARIGVQRLFDQLALALRSDSYDALRATG